MWKKKDKKVFWSSNFIVEKSTSLEILRLALMIIWTIKDQSILDFSLFGLL